MYVFIVGWNKTFVSVIVPDRNNLQAVLKY